MESTKQSSTDVLLAAFGGAGTTKEKRMRAATAVVKLLLSARARRLLAVELLKGTPATERMIAVNRVWDSLPADLQLDALANQLEEIGDEWCEKKVVDFPKMAEKLRKHREDSWPQEF